MTRLSLKYIPMGAFLVCETLEDQAEWHGAHAVVVSVGLRVDIGVMITCKSD